MLESEIKRRCSALLSVWGWEVIHLIQTSKNGIPDTLILRKSVAVFVEFKRPGKNPGPLQQYRHDKLKKQGFEVMIVRGESDIVHLQ